MINLSVAICDDMDDWREIIKERVLDLFGAENLKPVIHMFSTCKALDESLAQGEYYDMLFLDIEMQENDIDGIKLGHIIRKKYKYDEAYIFYVTSFTKYLPQAIDIHPYNFIEKSQDVALFNRKVADAINMIKRSRDLFDYKIGKSLYSIRKARILYLESRKRDIILNFKDALGYQKTVYKGALKDESRQLYPPDFVEPHTSFIINLRYMDRYGPDKVTMADGKVIPISRNKRTDFLKALIEYDKQF